MKVAVVFACVCITFCSGAMFVELSNPNAGKGKCLSSSYPELGPLNYGESRDIPKKCIRISCSNDGSITGSSCAAIGVSPECTLTDYDYSKPYPKCCPEVKC